MKIREEQRKGVPVWVLDIGIVEGKRRRRFFKTQRAASIAMREEQENQKIVGKQWVTLPQRERLEFMIILKEIENAGLTLRQVWSSYLNHNLNIEFVPLKKAAEQFLKSKQDSQRRSAYVKQLIFQVNKFVQGRSMLPTNAVTADVLREYLSNYRQPETRATVQRRLSTFLGWCHKQGWHTENPADKLERIIIDREAPSILTVAECKKLLQVAKSQRPEVVGDLVLMLFEGIRNEEMQRISSNDIDLEHGTVEISAAASKTRRRRVITLEPLTIKWLKAFPFESLVSARSDRYRELRKAAGFKVWKKDVLRHTAASHLYALHGAVKTAMILGNSEQILHQHYRNIVKPKESSAFWKLSPSVK